MSTPVGTPEKRPRGRPRSYMPAITTTVRLPFDEFQILEAYAVVNDMNLSAVVREAVRAYCIRKPAAETESETA